MASPGLINLQTDLKSLRYGSDKPYVTKDINNPPSSNQTGMQITKRIDDLSRIGQMLIDRPGLKFLGNQALLQQTDTVEKLQKASTKGGRALGKEALNIAKKTAIGTAKIVGSTLAQVPVNGTGTHFVYGFRTDTYLQPSGNDNRSAFAQFFGAGGVEGAPFALRGEEVPGVVKSSLITANNPLGKVQNPETGKESKYQYNAPVKKDEQDVFWNEVANKKIEDALPVLQNSYKAKQGQIIDVTKKEKVRTSTSGDTITGPDGEAIELPSTTPAIDTISTKETTEAPGALGGTSIDNVVGDYTGPQGLFTEVATEYTSDSTYIAEQKKRVTKNVNVLKENRILLGDQGARRDENKSKNRYWITSDLESEIDSLNALEPVPAKVNGEEEGRDLVKFRFHVITPTETTVLYFRAFLDQFADNYTGQWNPTKYLGRAEDFQVYGGFQRKITLSFKIAAATRSEMKPLYQKMLYLASSTAPTYADNGQFMRGTIVKMTVGDYVYELPGVMNSVGYSWNVEYPWEIAMTEPEGVGDTTMQELPMVMDCQIDFTPIHTFTPETGLKKYFTAGTNGTNSFI